MSTMDTPDKKAWERMLPRWAILPLLICLGFNNLLYFVPRLFLTEVHHFDFTMDIDRSVPFVPEWVYIYLVCYLFWAANYILVGRGTKEELYRFLTAEMTAKLICGILFILIPTTNVRPEVPGTDLASVLMRMVYDMDEPTNLFPSIHCLVSWFCFLGIRDRKDIPTWYKGFSAVFAILVFLSTQFTKQHYAIDVLGGWLLAEVSFAWNRREKAKGWMLMQRFFESINRKVWGEYES